MKKDLLPSEKIRSGIKISSYVRKHFPDIKLSGSRDHYRCSCPIHGGSNETTFSIDDEKGLWTCFAGCGSGSIIDLWLAVNKRSQSDIVEAMESLADESSITITTNKGSHYKLSKRVLADVVKQVCKDAHNRLKSQRDSFSKEAWNYLIKERALVEEDIDFWEIGILPTKTKVIDFLIESAEKVCGKQAKQALKEVYLIEKSQYDQDKLFCALANMIVFPIRDKSGRYVGMSARILPSEDAAQKQKNKTKPKPKYINSKSSELFDKSSVMFGEHLAVTNVSKQTSHIYICEGQMDVISLSIVLNDEEVALATCGTSLTEEHMKWVSNFKHVTVVFDGDEAGSKASTRSLSIINHIGSKNVDCIRLKSGKDANEILVNKGDEALINELENVRIPLVDSVAREMWNRSNENPNEFYEEAKKAISGLTRSVEKKSFISSLSRESGIAEKDISRELSMTITKKSRFSTKEGKNKDYSKSIQTFAGWIMSLSTREREALLLNYDKMLKNSFVRKNVLGAQTSSDCALLYYLAFGDNMLKKNKKYTMKHLDQSAHYAQYAHSVSTSTPRTYLSQIGRVLLNEIASGEVDKIHFTSLKRIALGRFTDEESVEVLSQLTDIIEESFL